MLLIFGQFFPTAVYSIINLKDHHERIEAYRVANIALTRKLNGENISRGQMRYNHTLFDWESTEERTCVRYQNRNEQEEEICITL